MIGAGGFKDEQFAPKVGFEGAHPFTTGITSAGGIPKFTIPANHGIFRGYPHMVPMDRIPMHITSGSGSPDRVF